MLPLTTAELKMDQLTKNVVSTTKTVQISADITTIVVTSIITPTHSRKLETVTRLITATSLRNGTLTTTPSTNSSRTISSIPTATSSPLPPGYVIFGTVYVSILGLLLSAVAVLWTGIKIRLAFERYMSRMVSRTEDVECGTVNGSLSTTAVGKIRRRLARSDRKISNEVHIEIEMQLLQPEPEPGSGNELQQSMDLIQLPRKSKEHQLSVQERTSSSNNRVAPDPKPESINDVQHSLYPTQFPRADHEGRGGPLRKILCIDHQHHLDKLERHVCDASPEFDIVAWWQYVYTIE